MTRFLRPLANKVLVVSEVSGGAAEQATWGRAIVFANSSSSSSDGGGGRRGGASEEEALRGPVSDLVQRSCPAWRPTSTDP